MSVSVDILRSWRHPRAVMRTLLDGAPREDRALIFLMTACLLIFIGQWPRVLRDSYVDPSTPLDARLGGALMAWMFIVPLVGYVLAALAHLAARMFGGQGSWYSARLALFWSLLAVAPAWLAYGLLAGYLGAGVILTVAGGVAFAAFLIIWLSSMVEAETKRNSGDQ